MVHCLIGSSDAKRVMERTGSEVAAGFKFMKFIRTILLLLTLLQFVLSCFKQSNWCYMYVLACLHLVILYKFMLRSQRPVGPQKKSRWIMLVRLSVCEICACFQLIEVKMHRPHLCQLIFDPRLVIASSLLELLQLQLIQLKADLALHSAALPCQWDKWRQILERYWWNDRCVLQWK
jgi:hypothetical protein